MVGMREGASSKTKIILRTGMKGSPTEVPCEMFKFRSCKRSWTMTPEQIIKRQESDADVTSSSSSLQVSSSSTVDLEISCRNEKRMEDEPTRAGVWSNLPPELTERVLARLPFQSIMKFRSVCRSWNRLLSSRTFLDEVYQVFAHGETWFLSGTVTQNKLALFSPSLNKWHIVTLPLINMINFDDIVVPEATMGGLVCLTKYSRQEEWTRMTSELFVWNPLTSECRKLPESTNTCPWPCLTACVAGMFVDFNSKQYKLITVGNYCCAQDFPGGNSNIAVVTEIYDSGTKAWKVGESLFPHQTVSRLTRWNICCNGSVYSVTRKPYTIVAFDMKTEVWREIAVPIADVQCPNLVELHDRLFMVAGISRDESIRIWRLLEHADGRVRWTEVDRMPEEFLKLLSTTKTAMPLIRHWRCVGNGDSLFFRCWGSQEVLMYNITGRTWSWLPACDLDNNRQHYAWNGLASSPGWVSP